MKFIAFLVGISLLIIGLLAYAVIPNVHHVSVQSISPLSGPVKTVVNPNYGFQTQQNVTVIRGNVNTLLVSVTVSTEPGVLSSVRLKLFTPAELGNCMRDTNPSGCIVDQDVSNQTVRVPLNASGTYYLSFQNKDAYSSQTVLLSTSVETMSVTSFITRDGESNFVALGLGVFGLFVAVYGVTAKTVIPWE